MKIAISCIFFLFLLFLLSCNSLFGLDSCDKKLEAFAKNPRDPRVFGVWYDEDDKMHLEVDNEKVNTHYFREDGYHNDDRLTRYDHRVVHAWYTDKDTLLAYTCKNTLLIQRLKAVYRCDGDTLNLYFINKKTGQPYKKPWRFFRYKR